MLNVLGHLPKFCLLYLEPKNLDAKEKVTVFYRYISWLMTSFFYLLEPPNNILKYKIAVVVALFVFSRIIMEYYLSDASHKTVQTMIVIETIFLTLLLIPTGGLDSPFIWYALNPVLIASNYLKVLYCWVDLFFYLTASVLISFKIFNVQGLTLPELIRDKSYIILVYILVTIAMSLLAHLIKHLDQQAVELKNQRQELLRMNEKLQEANVSVHRSMEYVMSLYHIIEMFSSRKDSRSVLTQVVDSTVRITESRGAFLWLVPYKDEPSILLADVSCEQLNNALSLYLNEKEDASMLKEESPTFKIDSSTFLASRVQSVSRFYGYIGIELSPEQSGWFSIKKDELLTFLGELVALVLERYEGEKIASKLMIMEEQNRIGNEIHDNVSQRLFSLLCGIHALHANWSTLDAEKISEQLRLLEQTTKDTSKDLRSSIYSLSSTKRGETLFKDNLHNYLFDFASLNQVHVHFNFQGDEERISSNLKQAIHRIIREACGNAVRHGQCTEVEVSFSIYAATIELVIKDNGKGFDTESVLSNRENRGLGLNNIYVLTQTFNGRIELISEENKGTAFLLNFPLGYDPEQLANEKGGAA